MRDQRKFGSGRPPSIANTVERRAREWRDPLRRRQRLRQQALIAVRAAARSFASTIEQAPRGSRSSSRAAPARRSARARVRRSAPSRPTPAQSARVRPPNGLLARDARRRECLRCDGGRSPERQPRSLLRRRAAARRARPATACGPASSTGAEARASAPISNSDSGDAPSARGVDGMRQSCSVRTELSSARASAMPPASRRSSRRHAHSAPDGQQSVRVRRRVPTASLKRAFGELREGERRVASSTTRAPRRVARAPTRRGPPPGAARWARPALRRPRGRPESAPVVSYSSITYG